MTPFKKHDPESTDDPLVISAIGFAFGLTMLGLLALVGAVVVG